MIENANMELYAKLLREYGSCHKEEQKPEEKKRYK